MSFKRFAEWLGVEFGQVFECDETKDKKYIIDNSGVYWIPEPSEKYYQDDHLIKKIVKETLTIKWVPKNGETYYFPSAGREELVSQMVWAGCDFDKRIMKNLGIYKTKEQAKSKAESLGWVGKVD